MTSANLHDVESMLAKYPIFQYGFLDSNEIKFSDRVRYICETECERYNTSWSCPPAVGSIESCRLKCREYNSVLLFSTLAEVDDPKYIEESLQTGKEHEAIVAGIRHEMERLKEECLVLSSRSCDVCSTCTWPDAPCRYPKQMLPCIESYGILVVDAAKKCGMDFFCDMNTIIWFGLIFFHRICQ